MKVFCSTGGFENISFYETGKLFSKLGIDKIELSAGVPSKDVVKQLANLRQDSDLMLHNYFPPPEIPFVLNLASIDEVIVKKSVEFFQTGIELSADVGAKYFGVHAGFLSDISVSEIGNLINSRVLLNRDKGMEIFISNINTLGNYASNRGVTLLVENNVLSKRNFAQNQINPLLFSDPDEIAQFFQSVRKDVKLLLDFGHLKVSANTLGFDLSSAVSRIQPWVGGYHLSENRGELDDHLNFDADAWFFPYLDPKVDFATLEIKHSRPEDIYKTWKLTNEKINAMLN
jgi:sugar phosphate isomerase/epimerase